MMPNFCLVFGNCPNEFYLSGKAPGTWHWLPLNNSDVQCFKRFKTCMSKQMGD